jgi:hypothetical protein
MKSPMRVVIELRDAHAEVVYDRVVALNIDHRDQQVILLPEGHVRPIYEDAWSKVIVERTPDGHTSTEG